MDRFIDEQDPSRDLTSPNYHSLLYGVDTKRSQGKELKESNHKISYFNLKSILGLTLNPSAGNNSSASVTNSNSQEKSEAASSEPESLQNGSQSPATSGATSGVPAAAAGNNGVVPESTDQRPDTEQEQKV